jgi:hypothetical protein
LLIALADQTQTARLLMFFGAHVLDVYLTRRRKVGPRWNPQTCQAGLSVPSPTHLASLQTQFDLHLACLGPHPHVDLGDKTGGGHMGDLGTVPIFKWVGFSDRISGILGRVVGSPLGHCLVT